jgi:hypothetical protein
MAPRGRAKRTRCPLAAEGESGGTTAPRGFLLYRVYLPTSGSNGYVLLPKLTLVNEGVTVTLLRCPVPTGKVAAALLPSESFIHAVQNAPQDVRPEGATKAMGADYPHHHQYRPTQFEVGAPPAGDSSEAALCSGVLAHAPGVRPTMGISSTGASPSRTSAACRR